MARFLGMPAVRPFSIEGATEDEPVFVINRDHLAEWRDEVRHAGVELEHYEVFEGKEVIGFSSDEARKLLAKANLTISKRHVSDTAQVEWLWLKAEPEIDEGVRALTGIDSLFPATPVKFVNWNGVARESFGYLASKIFGRALKRKIALTAAGGDSHPYSSDGDFQIYVWSTPLLETEREAIVPDKIWNIDVHERYDAFQPKTEGKKRSGRGKKAEVGIPIIDGKYIVAELFSNALYIHHNMVRNGCEHEFMLFAEIMKRAAKYVSDPVEWERYLEAERRQLEKVRERAIVAMIDRSVTKRAGRAANTLKDARAKTERLRVDYFAAERELFNLQDNATDPERVRSNFMAEFKKLETGKVGYIETIKLGSDRPEELSVFTKEITAQHPRTGQHYLLGRFEIIFNLERGDLRILNRDRTIRWGDYVCHSPHVFKVDGSHVCRGNIESELQAYIAHYEIEAAAALTVGFLQSVKDEGSYIDRLILFPKANEAAQP